MWIVHEYFVNKIGTKFSSFSKFCTVVITLTMCNELCVGMNLVTLSMLDGTIRYPKLLLLLMQLGFQVRVLYHPSLFFPVLGASLLQTTLVHVIPDVVHPPQSCSCHA